VDFLSIYFISLGGNYVEIVGSTAGWGGVVLLFNESIYRCAQRVTA
jgi:hypothetical protein